ncbi:2003_t:CDS:1, partial [Scutellospora calospora]
EILTLSQQNDNTSSTVATGSSLKRNSDCLNMVPLKVSNDFNNIDISLLTTNESNTSRITIPKTSDNEVLLDDASIGHIMNIVDTIGLDPEPESKLISYDDNLPEIHSLNLHNNSSKINYGYAEVSCDKSLTSSENAEDCSNNDYIVNDDDETKLRRSKSNLSRKSSIRQKSLDNGGRLLSRTSTVNSNLSTTEIIEEDLKESDTININNTKKNGVNRSLHFTKRVKSIKFLNNLFKSKMCDQDKYVSSSMNNIPPPPTISSFSEGLAAGKLSSPSTDNNNNNNRKHDERNGSDVNESKKVVNNGYSNFYLAMPNGQWM